MGHLKCKKVISATKKGTKIDGEKTEQKCFCFANFCSAFFSGSFLSHQFLFCHLLSNHNLFFCIFTYVEGASSHFVPPLFVQVSFGLPVFVHHDLFALTPLWCLHHFLFHSFYCTYCYSVHCLFRFFFCWDIFELTFQGPSHVLFSQFYSTNFYSAHFYFAFCSVVTFFHLKVPINFYSANFYSIHFYSAHFNFAFYTTVTFLHLHLRVPTTLLFHQCLFCQFLFHFLIAGPLGSAY